MFRRVERILLRVPNLASAAKHYVDAFGMVVVNQQEKHITLKYADAETQWLLHSDPELPDYAVYHLVDDVRALHAKRAELGLKFVEAPTRGSRGHRAAVRDRFGNVFHVIDHGGGSASDLPTEFTEHGRTATGLFAATPVATKPSEDRTLLVKLYTDLGRTADDLPYTPHFERLHATYVRALPEPHPDHAETWRLLLALRKRKGLPKLGKARSKPPAIPEEELQKLLRLLGDDVGRRDRLPYTARFDEIVRAFNDSFARPYSPHIVWRLVATLAK